MGGQEQGQGGRAPRGPVGRRVEAEGAGAAGTVGSESSSLPVSESQLGPHQPVALEVLFAQVHLPYL